MNDGSNVNNKKEREHDSLNYKYVIVVIFITILVVMGALGFSFSFFNPNTADGDTVINNIIAIFRHDDDDDDEDDEEKPYVIFNYVEKDFVGNGIRLLNQYPVSDEVGQNFKGADYVFEFRLVLNKWAKGTTYNIVAEKLINSDLREDLVKVYLESEGKVIKNVVRPDGSFKTFDELAQFEKHNINKNESLLYKGTITHEEARRGYKDFVFKMWISDDQKMNVSDFERTFIARINVYAEVDWR